MIPVILWNRTASFCSEHIAWGISALYFHCRFCKHLFRRRTNLCLIYLAVRQEQFIRSEKNLMRHFSFKSLPAISAYMYDGQYSPLSPYFSRIVMQMRQCEAQLRLDTQDHLARSCLFPQLPSSLWLPFEEMNNPTLFKECRMCSLLRSAWWNRRHRDHHRAQQTR